MIRGQSLRAFDALVLSFFLLALPAASVDSSQTPLLAENKPDPKIMQGTASWYSETDPGILKTTANMEIFDDSRLTCAMWDTPFHTRLKVTNLANGKSVIVRVNDRGPAKRLVKKGRIIDLTKHAFAQIADLKKGLISIQVEVL